MRFVVTTGDHEEPFTDDIIVRACAHLLLGSGPNWSWPEIRRMARIKEVSPGNGATVGKKIALFPKETLTLVKWGLLRRLLSQKQIFNLKKYWLDD